MITFDRRFFRKYIPQGQEVEYVVHKHFLAVGGKLTLRLSIALIPYFFYYQSLAIQAFLPVLILQLFLVIMYAKIIYILFDWYNDVWIITGEGITDLQWSLLKVKMNSVNFNNIEGLGVEQEGVSDKAFSNGDLIAHKIGTDAFVLEDVFKPYTKLEIIEEISSEGGGFRNDYETNQKLSIVMDKLGSILEKYMDDEEIGEEHKKKQKETIKKYQEEKETINLR